MSPPAAVPSCLFYTPIDVEIDLCVVLNNFKLMKTSHSLGLLLYNALF